MDITQVSWAALMMAAGGLEVVCWFVAVKALDIAWKHKQWGRSSAALVCGLISGGAFIIATAFIVVGRLDSTSNDPYHTSHGVVLLSLPGVGFIIAGAIILICRFMKWASHTGPTETFNLRREDNSARR